MTITLFNSNRNVNCLSIYTLASHGLGLYGDCPFDRYSHEITAFTPEDLKDSQNLILHIGIPNMRINEHPELLGTADKVYFDKDCTFPRNLARQSFKTSLSADDADVYVIPDMTLVNYKFEYYCYILEYGGIQYVVFADSYNEQGPVKRILDSMPIGDIMYNHWRPSLCSLETSAQQSKLVYRGPLLFVMTNTTFIGRFIKGEIPEDKVVLETSLLSSLSCETNKPTAETMFSVYNMLKSSDDDTKILGIKALCSLDYFKYKETTKFILIQTGHKKRLTSALSNAASKFMYSMMKRNEYEISYGSRISQEDYDLFVEVRKLVFQGKEMQWYPFMCSNEHGKLIPHLL